MQKIMWKIGASVAYSTPWVNSSLSPREGSGAMSGRVGGLVRKIVNMDLVCKDVPTCITRFSPTIPNQNMSFEPRHENKSC